MSMLSMLFLAVPSPNVTVTIDQNSSVVSVGTNLTLTCVIELPPEVDTNITLNINWTGPAGDALPGSSTLLIARMPTSRYESILRVKADQFGNYSCTAIVLPSSFLASSEGSATSTIIGKNFHFFLTCGLHFFGYFSTGEVFNKIASNKFVVYQAKYHLSGPSIHNT